MDSSELTKFRRNRVASNSHNGQKATRPANKITQMSSSLIMDLVMGSRKVVNGNTTILPNCGGPTCNYDGEGPPDIIPAGWVTSIGGFQDDRATDITMDKSNSYLDGKDYVLVTGIYTSTSLKINDYLQLNSGEIETSLFGVMNETTPSQRAYVVKYDNTNGHAKWATKIEGSGGVTTVVTDSIKTDSSGNVYVSGRITQNDPTDLYTVRFYNSSLSISGTLTPSLYGSIKLSSSASGGPPPPLPVPPKTDAFLVKYNKDGIVLAATLIGNNATSNAYQNQSKTSITIDSSGNPWISGSYVNPTGFYVFSSVSPIGLQLITLTPIQPVTALNGRNGFIAKYNPTLTTLLGFTSIGMEAINTDVQITGIASYGTDVFVVGTAINTSASPVTIKFNSCQVNPAAPPPFVLVVSSTSNINPSSQISTNFIAWYDYACVFKKKAIIQSTSVISRSIGVDNAGGVYITGTYYGTLGIQNDPPNPSGYAGTLAPVSGGSNPDGFILKYTTTSTPSISLAWATTIAKLKIPGVLTIDKSSSPNYVALTGIIPSGGIDFNNFSGGIPGTIITTPYGTLVGGVTSGDAFVAKYTTQGSVIWATADRGVTSGSDEGTGVTTDSDGNVVICGVYTGGDLNVYDYSSNLPLVTPTLFGYLAGIGVTDSFIAKYMKNTGSVLNA